MVFSVLFVAFAIFIPIAYCSDGCSYVSGPYITQCYNDSSGYAHCYESGKDGAIPLYYCINEVNEGREESLYFACIDDRVYALRWNETGCNGVKNSVWFSEVEDHGHYCAENEDYKECDIFHVITSELDTPDDDCELNEDDYSSQLWLNGVCALRGDHNNESAIAICSEDSEYRQYKGYKTDDCSGTPDFVYNVTDGECVEDRDDGDRNLTFVDVVDCGPTKRHVPFFGSCSYVENPRFYYGDAMYGMEDEKKLEGAVPMWNSVDDAVCFGDVLETKGSRSYKLVCDPILQIGFVLSYDNTFCDGNSTKYVMYDYTNFECGKNPCPYVHIRTSKAINCGLNSANYSEEIWITDYCSLIVKCDDGDSNCNDDDESRLVGCSEEDETIYYEGYSKDDCSGSKDIDIEVESGECIDNDDLPSSDGDQQRYVELVTCQESLTSTTASPKGNGDGVDSVMWSFTAVFAVSVLYFVN